MHTDLLAQHLFCDLLGLKQPVLYLFGQMTYALNDIPAAAIVRSNIQGQTGVVLRQRLGFANTFPRRALKRVVSPMIRRRTLCLCRLFTSLSSAQTNSSISALTSCAGRFQFSLLNAYNVNASIPLFAAKETARRTDFAPALWPKARIFPCRFAQRPLPSIIMAT